MPTHVDLDIDAIRADILRRQHEAMRPYQEELRKLEIAEEVLTQRANAKAEIIQFVETHQALLEGEVPAKAKREAKKRAKPNGQHKPYLNMTQSTAIIAVVTEEPGVDYREITTRLEEGGFPFIGKDHLASAATAVRAVAKTGSIVGRKEKSKNRALGEQSMKLHYYLADPRARTRAVRRQKSQAPGVFSKAVRGVLEGAPDGGYDRGEILAILEDQKFTFPEGSHHSKRERLSWTLNAMIDRGSVLRHKHGHLPGDTKFTLASQ